MMAADRGWLTEAEMVEVDRVMIDDLGITLVQMMENAGRSLAQLTIDRYAPSRVVICAGSGGNGGGGMVAARHLANRGVAVSVVLARPMADVSGVPGAQLAVLGRMGVGIADEVNAADLLIDAVIGYSLRGAPRGRSLELIEAMNESADPVLSLDVPSGLDATTGATPGVVIRADATLTLAAPKLGLRSQSVGGDLFVADISVPPRVLEELGQTAPDFSGSPILAVVT